MKTIKYFFFAAISLLFITGCSNKDSEFYNDIYLSVPNLVTIDQAGSTLYVNADIPRYLDEPGKPNKLDIYKSTSGAVRLYFTYFLERKIDATNWALEEIPQSRLDVIRGEATAGQFVTAASLYNNAALAADQAYGYRVGITSLVPGVYRLSFGYNSESATDVEFRSDTFENNLFLNLNSRFIGLDGGGYYNFTVL